MGILLANLRMEFAEFLGHDSLDRLSILYLPTCFGLRYGYHKISLEAFLGNLTQLNFRLAADLPRLT